MAKSILRQTHQETVFKVWGPAGTTETVSLASDLLSPAQELDGSTPKANIVGTTWTGQNATEITVARGGTTIMTLPSTGSSTIDFGGQALPPDSTNNTNDFTVSIAGGVGEVWVKVRKVSGYRSKSGEYSQYGAYEDEDRVGASTTINGSPDYVAP